MDDFRASPVFGVGAFRFNDEDRVRSHVAPGVWLVTSGTRSHEDFGAHNVYLQVASELGLLGLAVLVWVLVRASSAMKQLRLRPPLVGGILAYLWAIGLVSNGILSPAVSVTLVIVFALSGRVSTVVTNSRTGVDSTSIVIDATQTRSREGLNKS